MGTTNTLASLRMLTGAFIGGVIILTVVMFFVAPDTIVPEPWVIAVLLGLVAASAVTSLVLIQQIPAAPPEATLPQIMATVMPTHILRLALTEAPAIIAIVLAFMAEEPSWVTVAVGTVPTVLVMLLLVFPHEGVLRRYERQLDAGGVRTRFTDQLLGHTA